MQTILCATDLSTRSAHATHRAFQLASQLGADLRLVSVVDTDLPAAMAARLREEVLDEMHGAASVLKADYPCRHEFSAVIGDPTGAVLDIAEDIGADLVVLGLHRPRRFLDRLRETTMERVTRGLGCPVLLVANSVGGAYRDALVPIDFSPACTRAMRVAAGLVGAENVRAFHAVHVSFGQFAADEAALARGYLNDARARLDAWLEDAGLPAGMARPDIIAGPVGEVLRNQIARARPDLLAIGAHTRFALSPWRLGTFAAELVRDPPTDLLVTRA